MSVGFSGADESGAFVVRPLPQGGTDEPHKDGGHAEPKDSGRRAFQDHPGSGAGAGARPRARELLTVTAAEDSAPETNDVSKNLTGVSEICHEEFDLGVAARSP